MQYYFYVSKIGVVFYMQIGVQVCEIYLVKKIIWGELQNLKHTVKNIVGLT